MYSIFQKSGVIDFDIQYEENNNQEIIKKILDKLVFSKDKFDISFIADNHVCFKQKIFKQSRLNSVLENNPDITILYKGSFVLRKNENNKLSVEYSFNNNLCILPLCLFTFLFLSFFSFPIYIGKAINSKTILFFIFVAILIATIWGISLFMFRYKANKGFINIFKNAVNKKPSEFV